MIKHSRFTIAGHFKTVSQHDSWQVIGFGLLGKVSGTLILKRKLSLRQTARPTSLIAVLWSMSLTTKSINFDDPSVNLQKRQRVVCGMSGRKVP